MAPPLTGLAEGDGIAIAYYNTPGGSGTADDCLIERREFSRSDGEPPNTEPQELFRFLDRDAQLAQVAWPTGTGLPAQPAGSIDWFWDLSAASGVQYEYRVTSLDTRSGGRLVRTWVP